MRTKKQIYSGGCCHASTYLEVKLPLELSVFGILPDFLGCTKSAMHTIEGNGFRGRLLFRKRVCEMRPKIIIDIPLGGDNPYSPTQIREFALFQAISS